LVLISRSGFWNQSWCQAALICVILNWLHCCSDHLWAVSSKVKQFLPIIAYTLSTTKLEIRAK
jgi:hypothetical protein